MLGDAAVVAECNENLAVGVTTIPGQVKGHRLTVEQSSEWVGGTRDSQKAVQPRVTYWRSTREGNGNPFQYSCLEHPMDRGAWWAIVHGVTKE